MEGRARSRERTSKTGRASCDEGTIVTERAVVGQSTHHRERAKKRKSTNAAERANPYERTSEYERHNRNPERRRRRHQAQLRPQETGGGKARRPRGRRNAEARLRHPGDRKSVV